MSKYSVEVYLSGRVTVSVEAESEDEAERMAFEIADLPELDKYYETLATVVWSDAEEA